MFCSKEKKSSRLNYLINFLFTERKKVCTTRIDFFLLFVFSNFYPAPDSFFPTGAISRNRFSKDFSIKIFGKI